VKNLEIEQTDKDLKYDAFNRLENAVKRGGSIQFFKIGNRKQNIRIANLRVMSVKCH
jgi:hypothetical protein